MKTKIYLGATEKKVELKRYLENETMVTLAETTHTEEDIKLKILFRIEKQNGQIKKETVILTNCFTNTVYAVLDFKTGTCDISNKKYILDKDFIENLRGTASQIAIF